MFGIRERPTFDVTDTESSADALVCGFSEYGLAGLTAANYLVEHLDLSEVGHVTTAELPTITPFEDGRPRHHTRLFAGDDAPVTVLVGELFVPPAAAAPFADAISAWATDTVDELVVLSGVPIAHGPEDHRAFSVATDGYRDRRLADTDIAPMGGGFLDGVNAAVTRLGLDTDLETCVLATPAHGQTPDVDAALRLLDAVTTVYGLDVDTEPLETYADRVQRYYTELADRMERRDERSSDDRMYM
ncbi:proteasome assembly chaperone family protein [Halomarina oriensis]|uniref:Proteasome assembly chaperone family protein n=1 Tax=Halomarina oriensis TaxID=671145 RepID=A0A6B0GMG4_9EURY|nr:PAC2 family protein [Halomarina oriensis]MWG36052.1 proteasome assembly chaperone family protein [Halomarina oriensis]